MSQKKIIKIRADVMPNPDDIRLGRLVSFIPAAFYHEISSAPKNGKPVFRSVTGTICYINRAHRYFTVIYSMEKNPDPDSPRFKESFNY